MVHRKTSPDLLELLHLKKYYIYMYIYIYIGIYFPHIRSRKQAPKNQENVHQGWVAQKRISLPQGRLRRIEFIITWRNRT